MRPRSRRNPRRRPLRRQVPRAFPGRQGQLPATQRPRAHRRCLPPPDPQAHRALRRLRERPPPPSPTPTAPLFQSNGVAVGHESRRLIPMPRRSRRSRANPPPRKKARNGPAVDPGRLMSWLARPPKKRRRRRRQQQQRADKPKPPAKDRVRDCLRHRDKGKFLDRVRVRQRTLKPRCRTRCNPDRWVRTRCPKIRCPRTPWASNRWGSRPQWATRCSLPWHSRCVNRR